MTNLEHDVKLDDIDQPFKPFLKNSMYQLSTSIFKSYYTEVQEIRINTDKSLIFTEMEETKSYKFINTRESVDTRKFHIFPGTFSQMLFITTGNTQIHKRSYKKLFDVIVQIGGFFNGIIYVAYFLNFLYSKNMIVWHCVTSLISTNEISENLDTNPNFKKLFEMDEISNSHRNKKTKEERVKRNNFVRENSENQNNENNENNINVINENQNENKSENQNQNQNQNQNEEKSNNSGSNLKKDSMNVSEEMERVRQVNSAHSRNPKQ